ncbi:MAG: outer membrane beta-barrel protein [Sphingomonadaceae bacterium]
MALLLVPAPLLAQEPAPSAVPLVEADPRRVLGDEAPFLGGLDILAGIGLSLRAGLTTEYTDNVSNRSFGSGGLDSRSDWIFRPSVGIEVGRAIGRQRLFVNAGASRSFYARNDILNRNRFNVDGGLAWALGARCGGRVQGGWSTREGFRDLFEDVVPSTTRNTRFFANAACQTATGLAPSVSYDWSRTRNRSITVAGFPVIDRSFSDVQSQGVSASLGYPLSARGQVGVQGSWREYEFPNQPLPDGTANGNEVLSGSLFLNYRLGPSLRANASLGTTRVNPRDDLTPSFSGLTYSGGLNWSGPRLGASLSYGRSVSGSRGGTANYSIANSFSAGVNYRASDRASAAAGYARVRQTNRGNAAFPETNRLLGYTGNRYFIGADYRFNRILSASLDLNHQQRSSTPSQFDYDATSVILGLRARL